MIRKFDLHSLRDLVSLAQYVQSRVFWGGYFTRKDDEKSYRWKEFWDHMEDEINSNHIKQVVIYDEDQFVEFR